VGGGKFASPNGNASAPGVDAEKAVWEAVDQKSGWSTTKGRVYVKDADGNVRVYDGVATSPSGNNIGLEVKSGKAKKTSSQKEFDSNLNSSPANKATGAGKNKGLVVERALEIRTQ
jgi:hypothetical protein